jgi:hypothetical protein
VSTSQLSCDQEHRTLKDLQALQNLQEPHCSDDVVTIDINREEGLETIRFSRNRSMRRGGFEGDTTDILSNSK